MSQTITGDISSGVTLTADDTTIASTAQITTAANVEVALYGTLNESTGVTVTNDGTIIGSNYEAVVLENSYGDAAFAGTITNESGGLIDGSGGYGLLAYGPAVINNDANGTITGAIYAVGLDGDPSTVTNAGLIESTGAAGILEIGASATATLSVVNQAGGTIAGNTYSIYLESGQTESVTNQAGGTLDGEVDLDTGGTILNAGVIAVSSGTAVAFGSTVPARLIVDPGAVFDGGVAASSGDSNTVELAIGSGTTGTLAGFGSTITNFNTIAFDNGAKWTIAGNQVGLDAATISGFALGDTLDLTDFAATSERFANNALVLTNAANATATLDIQGSFASGNFVITPVAGGSTIQLAPLALANAQAGQTVLDNATLQPFSNLSVLDLNSGSQAETLTITLSNAGTVTNADGNLSGNGLVAVSPGIYTLTAPSAAAATAELDALVFTPTAHQVPVGSTVTTTFEIQATDTAASTATISATTVIATAVAATPTISGVVTSQSVVSGGSLALFSATSVTDLNNAATDLLTISLTGGGALSGSGLVSSGGGLYSLSGTAGAVTSALDALTFTPASGTPNTSATTSLTLIDSSTATASTASAGITITEIYPAVAPMISGVVASQGVVSGGTLLPFSATSITDLNSGATDQLTIVVSGGGTLSGAGVTSVGAGTYTISGTASAVTSALDAAVFTPTSGQPNTSQTTSFILTDSSTVGSSVTASGSVTEVFPAVAPTISGVLANQTISNGATLTPFSAVTITDANSGATDLLTIIISNGGTLSGPGVTSVGSDAHTTSYTISGTAGAVTSALDGVRFTPISGLPNTSQTTLFTLIDSSTADPATVASGGVVTDVFPPVAPSLSGTLASQGVVSGGTLLPFSATILTDPNVGATDVLTITVSGGGTLSGVGLVSSGGGLYSLSGSAAAVTSALDGVVFSPASGTPNTSTTTSFTLTDSSTAIASTASAATLVTESYPAVAPSIAGVPGGESVLSGGSLLLFSAATVSDPNAAATDRLTIVVSGGGTLSGSGLTSVSSGTYTLSGTAGAITSALDLLSYTPGLGTPNTSALISVTLVDSSSAIATSATAATTITASYPPVAPSISGNPVSQSVVSGGSLLAFSATTITDPNQGASDTLTISVTGGGSLTGSGLVASGGGLYTLSGSAAAVTSALDLVVFTPGSGTPNTSGITSITLTDSSTAIGTVAATSSLITTTYPPVAPVISGGSAAQTTTSEAPVSPFSGVIVSDANSGASDVLTISVGGAGGSLTGSGLTSGGAGTYTLSGSAAAITAGLDALVFTPVAGADDSRSTTSFSLTDRSSAVATVATASGISVTDIDPLSLYVDAAGADQSITQSLLAAALASLQSDPSVVVNNALPAATATSVAILTLPAVPSGSVGVASIAGSTGGVLSLPAGYQVLTDVATAPVTVLGNGGANDYIFAGSTGGFTFNTGGGSGSVVAGGGNNLVGTPTTGSGAYSFTVDGANDTVTAFTGNNTVNALGANALIGATNGNDVVNLGNAIDTVILGLGAMTVNVSVGGAAIIGAINGAGQPTNASLSFVNASTTGSTVFGGAGSDTIYGGPGAGGIYVGGTGGNNLITTGTGATTVLAGGNNDLVSVVGSGADQIYAAAGNETLTAITATGNDVFIAGAGQTSVLGSTVAGTPDIFAFFDGQTKGGSETIFNFTGSDVISTVGYNAAPVVTATATGSTIVLSDNTRITIFGVTSPTIKSA